MAASNDDLIRGPTDRQYMVRSGLRARARRAGLGAPVARDGYLALFVGFDLVRAADALPVTDTDAVSAGP